MTIANLREKCKKLLERAPARPDMPRDVLIFLIVILVALASFGLGYLTGKDAGQGSEVALCPATDTRRQVVASKNGTKYYFPSCTGAEKISETNKVWFASPELARQEGYTLATNCREL